MPEPEPLPEPEPIPDPEPLPSVSRFAVLESTDVSPQATPTTSASAQVDRIAKTRCMIKISLVCDLPNVTGAGKKRRYTELKALFKKKRRLNTEFSILILTRNLSRKLCALPHRT
jgi:hypothetical protein